jgi:MFS family permease
MSTTAPTIAVDPAAFGGPHPRAGRRVPPDATTLGLLAPRWRALTIGMLALVSIVAFEHLAVATVMPLVAQALGRRELYAAAFGAAMAAGIVGMVLAGRWSDRRGPLPPLFTGIVVFVAGVVAVGLAPDMVLLVAGRALQGLGGGLMGVTLYVLVDRAYPRELHPRVFAAFAAAWVLPVIVGPALAGAIAAHLGWRWVFLAAAVIALPAVLLLRQGLRHGLHDAGRAPDAGTSPLTVSAGPAAPAAPPSIWIALATAGFAGLLYAGEPGSATSTGVLGVALVGLALFTPRLLPRGTLVARRGLPAVVALRGLAAAAFFAGEVLIPLLLIEQRGLSAWQAGLVLTLGALGWSAGSWLHARLAAGPAWRRRALLRAGIAGIAVGLGAIAPVLLAGVPVVIAAVAWTVAGVGIGIAYPMLSVLTLENAAPGERGAASAALQLADSIFSATGLALASALVAALQSPSPAVAYAAGFGFAATLALAGALLAPRAFAAPRAPE